MPRIVDVLILDQFHGQRKMRRYLLEMVKRQVDIFGRVQHEVLLEKVELVAETTHEEGGNDAWVDGIFELNLSMDSEEACLRYIRDIIIA